MAEDSEKRDHKRHPFVGDVMLEFASGKREARISDICQGGCDVDTIASVVEGETIGLAITASFGECMRFTGKVVYILHGMGFGVCFTDLSDEGTAFLSHIIAQNS